MTGDGATRSPWAVLGALATAPQKGTGSTGAVALVLRRLASARRSADVDSLAQDRAVVGPETLRQSRRGA